MYCVYYPLGLIYDPVQQQIDYVTTLIGTGTVRQ